MRIGLLTEGGYPYVSGEARLWCDRLVRGLGQHEFDIYALSRSEQQEDEGWIQLPSQVSRVRTAPLWTANEDGVAYGRRARRRFAEAYGELAAAMCAPDALGGAVPDAVSRAGAGAGSVAGAGAGSRAGVDSASGAESGGFAGAKRSDEGRGEGRGEGQGEGASAGTADRFGSALYGLAELARDEGGMVAALRSEVAVRALERACRAPGALRAARTAHVPDLLTVAAQVERALRPLSLDWYGDDGLGSVDLCHATSGGAAALPGLLARHFSGVPLLVTEYGVQLRAHYLGPREDLRGHAASAPARALLAAFHGRLAAEAYRQATVITPGNTHARRWQERCGADRTRIRTVYPGMEASRFSEVGESADHADPYTLVWVGRIEPAKDLVSLLHAFAEIRKEEPKARLRIVGAPAEGPEGATYLAQCRALAAQLFPDGAAGVRAVGDHPVSFEEIGGADVPTLPEAYAAGALVVLSSVVEGFPISLVEAMFAGRATVSTDVGAVVEVIGGTGLVVPPRNPRALAEACVALLRDPERRSRLGAAARARALELFTVEQNIMAFHSIYLDIVSHCPVRRDVVDASGEPLPFAIPVEAQMPGRWPEPGAGARPVAARPGPGWAAGPPVRGVPLGLAPGEPVPAGEGAW
ncbi:transferase [Streptomyces dioscori]|uniref:D-inositol 3-phosphate glycosyltransferase n=1 Tax=Streptomyces dioscori TaxID=2109333 RepID=A0A2P8PZX9_9ACTN|nr:DUF3492 domain-containing protein [Streptomyces dioscori]PSM39557.1 transferase [Streptomyces dioscori]